MEKRYKRLQAKAKRNEGVASAYAASFFVRTVVCLLLFLVLAGVRLYSEEFFAYAKKQIAFYMTGEQNFSGAYAQSVEVFNLFCDRIVEAQDD